MKNSVEKEKTKCRHHGSYVIKTQICSLSLSEKRFSEGRFVSFFISVLVQSKNEAERMIWWRQLSRGIINILYPRSDFGLARHGDLVPSLLTTIFSTQRWKQMKVFLSLNGQRESVLCLRRRGYKSSRGQKFGFQLIIFYARRKTSGAFCRWDVSVFADFFLLTIRSDKKE